MQTFRLEDRDCQTVFNKQQDLNLYCLQETYVTLIMKTYTGCKGKN